MLLGLRLKLTDCIRLSPPCLLNHVPCMQLISSYISHFLLRTTPPASSSFKLSRKLKFVSFLTPLDSPQFHWAWTSNHDDKQVIATFLIILRVANRSPLTSQTITGSNNSIHFRRQGNLTGRNELLSDTYPMSPMGTNGKTTGEIGVGVGATIYTKRSKESLKS